MGHPAYRASENDRADFYGAHGPAFSFFAPPRSHGIGHAEPSDYCASVTAGGCHVPSPGGRIDGGVSFGQYRRSTR